MNLHTLLCTLDVGTAGRDISFLNRLDRVHRRQPRRRGHKSDDGRRLTCMAGEELLNLKNDKFWSKVINLFWVV